VGVAGLTETALYRALVESFPDVTVFVFGPDLHYELVLGAAFTRLGWRQEELIGRKPSEILPREEGLELEQHLKAALSGETRRYEHAGIRDATAIWSSTIAPVRAADGTIVAGLVVSHNVAAIRQAELARRQSEERFAVALEAAPVLVFSQDVDLRFTWSNKTVINPSPESILGKRDDEVLPADAAATTTRVKREVLETGVGQRILFEVASDAGARFFDMTLEPTTDEEGRVNGLVGAALDVTDLRTSERRLQAAMDAMLDSVTLQEPVRAPDGAIVDFQITFATSNARDFADRGRDELVGRTLRELYPALGAEFIAGYERVLDSGVPIRIAAFPYTDQAGVTRRYDLAANKFGNGLLVVWREVTDREEQRAVASRAEAVRATSEQLQRGLLPPDPPDIPGLRFATTYRPANQTAEVGGDWYGVVELTSAGEPAVDVVVGDAEGHDGQAAAIMARLSTVIAAESRRGVPLPDIIREVQSFHASLHTERLASLLLARIAPRTGKMSIASAGHPVPLIRRQDGSVVRLNIPPGPPIGIAQADQPVTECSLLPGETLLLFSDGLLDPQLDTDDAFAALAGFVEAHGASSVQELVDALANLTHTYQPSDDVVVLGVRKDQVGK
jgi:PAS domain S-box-containing protein